tara:strand:+ start:293 stop:949 length:657 start_codon:yes stop_codon:yes gene_type:complete
MLNLNKILLPLLLCGTVMADTTIKFGGMVKEEMSDFNFAFDLKEEANGWQREIESNAFYSKGMNNEGLLNGKVIFDFTGTRWEGKTKHYVFAVGGYNFDKYRVNEERIVAGIGHGIKLLRTPTTKASWETSVANLNTDFGNETIIRNSLWFFYKLGENFSVTNKYLLESGDVEYTRNETYLNYKLTDRTMVSAGNVYTKDPISDNIFTINLTISLNDK